MTRTVYFYATRDDLVHLCEGVEATQELTYALAGNIATDQAICYPSAVDIPDLGTSKKGAILHQPSFLIVARSTPITVFTRMRADAQAVYFVGQQHNPDSIDFQPSGVYDGKNVIQGALGSISKSQTSVKLYRLFLKMLQKLFSAIRGYYVGPEALQFNKQGGRLTQSIKLPIDTDLKIE